MTKSTSRFDVMIPCPYDSNFSCRVPHECLVLMNTGVLMKCTRFKGSLSFDGYKTIDKEPMYDVFIRKKDK